MTTFSLSTLLKRRYRALGLALFLNLLLGCAHLATPTGPPVGVEASAVRDCRYMGTFTENADPESLFPWSTAPRCRERVWQRARSVGATHLVWQFQNRTGASAEAYFCP